MRNLILSLWIIGAAATAAVSIVLWLLPSPPVLIPLTVNDLYYTTASHLAESPQRLRGDSSAVIASQNSLGVLPEVQGSASEFIASKQGAVVHDGLGNYCVELSTAGFDSREFLISDRPIFYPEQNMLDHTGLLQGCPLSAYYIENQAKGSLLVLRENTASIFHYQCTFDVAHSGYQLKKLSRNSRFAASLKHLLTIERSLCVELVEGERKEESEA